MAVQAQKNVTHGPRAYRAELCDATSSAMSLGEPGGGHLLAAAVGGSTVFSDLTCRNHKGNSFSGCFVPRKRARVGDGLIMERHSGALLRQATFAPARDAQSRALCSVAASTSGRPTPTTAAVSQGLQSRLYCRHSVETDAVIRIENERLRAGLQEARRRHVRAAVSALETAAARRLRDAEVELERSLSRNAELEQKVQQMGAEEQAWQGVAKSDEAVAAGLRATLDQLLLQSPPPCPCTSVEDAQSCCFEPRSADASDWTRACRSCGEAEACVLLRPCRHLCLCAGCGAAADACPMCAATRNASLHVLLS